MRRPEPGFDAEEAADNLPPAVAALFALFGADGLPLARAAEGLNCAVLVHIVTPDGLAVTEWELIRWSPVAGGVLTPEGVAVRAVLAARMGKVGGQ